MKVWYFAYGANMNEDKFRERIGRRVEGKRAVLPGWTLKFWKLGSDGTGKATIIEPAPGDPSYVEGVVYLINAAELQKLDRHEGYPTHYERITVIIYLVDDKKYEVALTYIARRERLQPGLKPSPNYLQDILEGAKQHNLSDLWIRYPQDVADIENKMILCNHNPIF